jgi:hypothetical protein
MNKQITVSDLDFESIKDNLKQFLKGQSVVSDYNFEGAGMSMLLDILAYNTHYNSLYTNFALNESFLDTASKRQNVVSISNSLGYTPRSARASTAIVDLIIKDTVSQPATITLPKYSQFTGTVNNRTFSFYNLQSVSIPLVNGQYRTNNVELKEGVPLIQTIPVSDNQRYIIQNANVDLSSLKVYVKENSSSDVITTFNLASDIIDTKSTDRVFFIKEIYDNKFEVYFGNDKIGTSLDNGNIVILEYFVTNKSAANGVKYFSFDNQIISGTSVCYVVQPSIGGDEPESIEEIKFNAPKLLNSNNRAVTVDDYNILIKHNFANIDIVKVWGGEDNVPPVYGKVFICIKPKQSLKLTTPEKNYIRSEIVKNKNIIGIVPEFVDPSYVNVEVNTTIYFDVLKTSRTVSDISLLAFNEILNYNSKELNQFDSIFRFSKLSKQLDDIDNSVFGNITTVKIRKPVTLYFNTLTPYNIEIGNPINNKSVSVESTGFYMTGDDTVYFLDDDTKGNIRRYKLDKDGNKDYVVLNQGTVNYSTGKIYIDGMSISKLNSPTFELIIIPKSNDIVGVRNGILQILPANITTNAIIDSSSGNNGVYNHIFTSSR